MAKNNNVVLADSHFTQKSFLTDISLVSVEMLAHSFLLSKVKAVAILTVEHSDGRRLQQKVKGRCRVAASEAAKAVYIKTSSEKFKNRNHQSSSIIGAKLKVLCKIN